MLEWNASKFRSKYLFSNTPVLIRNHPDLQSWEARESWRKTAFLEKFAGEEFTVYGAKERGERPSTFKMTLSEFLRHEQEHKQEPYWLVVTDTDVVDTERLTGSFNS